MAVPTAATPRCFVLVFNFFEELRQKANHHGSRSRYGRPPKSGNMFRMDCRR
jgi:hypothetical protein